MQSAIALILHAIDAPVSTLTLAGYLRCSRGDINRAIKASPILEFSGSARASLLPPWHHGITIDMYPEEIRDEIQARYDKLTGFVTDIDPGVLVNLLTDQQRHGVYCHDPAALGAFIAATGGEMRHKIVQALGASVNETIGQFEWLPSRDRVKTMKVLLSALSDAEHAQVALEAAHPAVMIANMTREDLLAALNDRVDLPAIKDALGVIGKVSALPLYQTEGILRHILNVVGDETRKMTITHALDLLPPKDRDELAPSVKTMPQAELVAAIGTRPDWRSTVQAIVAAAMPEPREDGF